MKVTDLDLPPGFEERFWSKVDRTADGCWPWPGAQNGRGYGTGDWHRRMVPHTMYTHRMAFLLEYGVLADGAAGTWAGVHSRGSDGRRRESAGAALGER